MSERFLYVSHARYVTGTVEFRHAVYRVDAARSGRWTPIARVRIEGDGGEDPTDNFGLASGFARTMRFTGDVRDLPGTTWPACASFSQITAQIRLRELVEARIAALRAEADAYAEALRSDLLSESLRVAEGASAEVG